MKIHIIGASGSGKTWLAGKLSEKYGIPAFELDDLFWDNSAGGYNVKRDAETRQAMLQDILRRDSWILEGVQHSWLGDSFAQADVIFLLETAPALCRLRIVRRFFRRKWHKISRKNETLSSLLRLLKWTGKFYRVNLPEILQELKPYESKLARFASKSELRHIL